MSPAAEQWVPHSPAISHAQLLTMSCRTFPAVRACLFDMDGLLLDTEDIYTKVTNTLLQQCGRPPLTWAIKAQLQGRPVSAVRTPARTPN